MYTARTDFDVLPVFRNQPIPAVGATAHDADFKADILRVTGPNFDPMHLGFAYAAGIGGSADENVWNPTSTKFVFEDQGNRVFVLGFDPVNFKVFPLYPGSSPNGTFTPSNGRGVFGHTGDALYCFSGTQIWKYDFAAAAPGVPPVPTLVYDFQPVMPGYTATWQSIGGLSADDQTFVVAMSNKGFQGTGSTIMVYRIGKGWRRFETKTGIVTGEWGMTGKITSHDKFTLHNVKLSPGGEVLVVVPGITDDALAKNKHFWNIETLEMDIVVNWTAGHFTQGYKTWINNGGVPFGQYSSRLFTAPTLAKSLVVPMPTKRIVPVLDSHLTWNNVDPDDTAMIFASTTSTNKVWQLWMHEVIGIQNNKVYRFCHTYNSGMSPLFSTANAIGCVSQDGNFFLWGSDWNGQTKGDLFIVRLK